MEQGYVAILHHLWRVAIVAICSGVMSLITSEIDFIVPNLQLVFGMCLLHRQHG